MRTRLASLLTVAALVAAPLSLVMASTAEAAGACRTSADAGNKRIVTKNFNRSWHAKQTDIRDNFSGSKRRLTFRADSTSTETNTVAGYAEGSVEAGIAWAKLSAKVGGSIEDVGSKTQFKSFTEQISLASGDTYVYSRGVRQYSLNVRWQRCSWGHPSTRGWTTYKHTKATAYDKVDAWLGCHRKVRAGSYSAYLKPLKC